MPVVGILSFILVVIFNGKSNKR